jgi:class 3 adenylate cyclase
MQCASCGFENQPESQFCEECGAKLVRVCPSCSREVRPSAKFCPACGTPLAGQSGVASSQLLVASPQHPTPNPQSPVSCTPTHLAARIRAEGEALAARGVAEGERKTITALFADVAGFTALVHDLDPEETRAIIDPALQLMMDAVHRYEGYVAQSLGDGIFALFGAPIAHEDHPQRALYAALRMQEELKRYADRLRLEKGVPLQLRVGINTGEVVLRSVHKDNLHTDYVPVGDSTNLAARMESLATPGSIVSATPPTDSSRDTLPVSP